MKKQLKTFLIINIFFLSFFLIGNVKAFNDNRLYLNYDSEVFEVWKSKYDLDNHIEEYKNKCASIYDDYVVSLYYYGSYNPNNDYYQQDRRYYAYQIRCTDISSFDEFYVRYKRDYTSGLFNFNRSSMSFKVFRVDDTTYNITDDIVYNSAISGLIGISQNISSPYYFFDNLGTTAIPVYSSKSIYLRDKQDDTSAKFYINDEFIDDYDEIKFYYNLTPSTILRFEDSCTSPGLCEYSSLFIGTDEFLDPTDRYKLEVYINGELYSIDEYVRTIKKQLPDIRVDSLVSYKLYKSSLFDVVYTLIEEQEYQVNTIHDTSDIRFTLSEFSDKYQLAIDYILGPDITFDYLNDYILQYRVDNGSWEFLFDTTLKFLEFDVGRNYSIQARVINTFGNVKLFKMFNINPSQLPQIRFEMEETIEEYQKVYVYVSNVLTTGYSYKINTGSGFNGPYSLNVSQNEVLIETITLGVSKTIYVNILDSSGNVISNFNVNVKVNRVGQIYDLDSSDNVFSFLIDYMNDISDDLNTFGNGLQDIVDEISGTSLERILLVILIILCLITTISLV